MFVISTTVGGIQPCTTVFKTLIGRHRWRCQAAHFPKVLQNLELICLLSLSRDTLKTFQTKCWSSGEAECSDSELRKGECLADMDPTCILGADSECKKAFLATVGTSLHHPCSCKGLNGGYLLTCSKIHSVFHNRSHFGEYSFDL